MFTSLKRIIRSGWGNFHRNIGLSVATCFILMLVILLLTSLFLVRGAAEYLIATIQEKADITVFFKENSSEEEILKVKEELAKNPQVKEAEYVSKKEALEKFIKEHEDEAELMKAVSLFENPFLAHLNINVFEAEQYPSLVNFLESSPFSNLTEEIDYSERMPIINRIFTITENVKKAGIAVSIILAIIAILVAFNTVRLAIYNSREEIKIQRLVGASNWFIRGPFLTQGLISGIFAALFSLLITYGILYFLSPEIESFLSDFNLLNYFFSNFSTLLLIQLATGAGLGIISSYIAIRKYLEV